MDTLIGIVVNQFNSTKDDCHIVLIFISLCFAVKQDLLKSQRICVQAEHMR